LLMRACGMAMVPYLDEAVVEVEAGEAGVDAYVGLVRLDQDLLHDVVGVRACAVVVVRGQLRHGAARAQGGSRHQQHAGDGGARCTLRTRGSHHPYVGVYVYIYAFVSVGKNIR
jgi:hypothetical protein